MIFCRGSGWHYSCSYYQLSRNQTFLNTKEAVVVVVGSQFVRNGLASTVGVKIARHVVSLLQHVVTQLVERRGRDHMALAIHLPGDGRILGADFVVARVASGGSSVHGDVTAHLTVNNHTAHQIAVEVAFVVDDGEDLSLDSDLRGSVGQDTIGTEHTVIERGLVLVGSTARSSSRVGPMDLVGLSDLHELAVLPLGSCPARSEPARREWHCAAAPLAQL